MRTKPAATLKQLSEHLSVHTGPINVGIIQDGSSALLVDFGPGGVTDDCLRLGIEDVQMILFTHHHRDQACGAWLAEKGVGIAVPQGERSYFEDVASYWNKPESRWHLYNFHPHRKMLAESLHVDRTLREGDHIELGSARISVLDTPGHTNGSVSYLVEADGQRVIFCGDVIHSQGKVWEIHSLQKGTETTDYHGFMGAREELTASLEKIGRAGPSHLVPSHGRIMSRPGRAIDLLARRMKSCYDLYTGSSALRFYFPKLFPGRLQGPGVMPMRACKPVPSFLLHFNTTWMVVSADGSAFAMDCGSPSVVEWVRKLSSEGAIKRVEALWITHYHDDHVDAVPEFKREFGCPVIADTHVAQVVENPLAWGLPCISPVRVAVDRRTGNGETWRWHEFTMTAYHLPGQTLYHGGLLVEGRGLRLFFAGDSFTPGGVDDYCAGNRNFLGKGKGFDLCLSLLERLKPDHVLNCHIDKAFDFTPGQLAFMQRNLARRFGEYGRLIAWDDPNYGIDGSWVRCAPYEQRLDPRRRAHLDVVITNHSSAARRAHCAAVFPRTWHIRDEAVGGSVIRAGKDGSIPLSWVVPNDGLKGRFVVPVDVTYGDRFLPQVTEAIVEVV